MICRRCTTGSRSSGMVHGALAHFSYAVKDVLNHDWCICRGRPAAWPPCSPDLNPLDFYMNRHLKTLVYAAALDDKEALYHHIVDDSQTNDNYPPPPNFWMAAVIHDEMCWGHALNLMEDIWSTYYRYHLSAITYKLNISGHMLIQTVFLVWCVEIMPKFIRTFQLNSVYIKEEFTFFLCFKQARKLILGTDVHLYPDTFFQPSYNFVTFFHWPQKGNIKQLDWVVLVSKTVIDINM
jgi:hypothetical protein